MKRAAPLFGIIALLAGCGASDDLSTGGQGSLCRGGTATPVPTAQVVTTLKARGFDIVLEEEDPICRIEWVVAHMTNSTGSGGLSKNAERLGHVLCTVDEEPQSRRRGLRERQGDGKRTFYAYNVKCTVYTRDEDGGTGIPLLRGAMQELAAAS